MVLTNQEFIENAMYVFMKYHQDEGYTIDNYLTFQQNYDYNIDVNQDVTISRWDLESTEPNISTLKSTYSLSDLDTIEHIYEDILYLQKSKYTALTTYDRLELTDYAQEGHILYDKNDSKLYIFTDNAWVALT